jgi:glutathione S-transferase
VGFEYVSVEEAIGRQGLRMVVVGGVPSPWGEAAKGLFHIKGIEWVGVRLAYDSEALLQWAGERSGPVAVYDKEAPRPGWREILLLAERLAPAPPLLPADPDAREQVLALASTICDQGGLTWTRRLQLVHAGLQGQPGFNARASAYLAKKYGHDPEGGAAAGAKVAEMLGRLAAQLKAQHAAGSDYFVNDALTAADVYAATAVALFKPLPQEVCEMNPATRAAFEALDPPTAAALDPVLFAHRDMMYARHLALPLRL